MAKSGVSEGDQATVVVRATELKKELQKLLKTIVDEDDVNLEAVDKAQQMLLTLKELKLKKKTGDLKPCRQEKDPAAVPEEFKCPLSKELMRDPVIISNGQTYDRPFIHRWLKSGKRTCPETQQVLLHTTLTPNHLIREMIMQWCKNHGIKLPESFKYIDEYGALTEADRDHFTSLLRKMTSTLAEQREAAQELRLMTKRTPSVRALFGETADAVPQLVAPLFQTISDTKVHQELQEDIVTTLLNISILENNKKHVAETPSVIPILVDAVRSGTIETRSNAAAALFTLAAIDSNRDLIGKSGAMKPLIDLLDEGHLLAMKDAATAIYNMCILHENRMRAIADGAVGVILRKIKSKMQVDELMTILAMLSVSQNAVEEMIDLDGVSCLLGIVRNSCAPRTEENCMVILHTICLTDRATWKDMRTENNRHNTITRLANGVPSRAQRKAKGILDKLRGANITHTA